MSLSGSPAIFLISVLLAEYSPKLPHSLRNLSVDLLSGGRRYANIGCV